MEVHAMRETCNIDEMFLLK